MLEVQKHLNKLGMKVRDRVTGLEGVITHVGFDLYGCIQAIVHPGVDDKGSLKDVVWFDIARLEITDDERAMPLPDFDFGYIAEGKKGPGEKPIMGKA